MLGEKLPRVTTSIFFDSYDNFLGVLWEIPNDLCVTEKDAMALQSLLFPHANIKAVFSSIFSHIKTKKSSELAGN